MKEELNTLEKLFERFYLFLSEFAENVRMYTFAISYSRKNKHKNKQQPLLTYCILVLFERYVVMYMLICLIFVHAVSLVGFIQTWLKREL